MKLSEQNTDVFEKDSLEMPENTVKNELRISPVYSTVNKYEDSVLPVKSTVFPKYGENTDDFDSRILPVNSPVNSAAVELSERPYERNFQRRWKKKTVTKQEMLDAVEEVRRTQSVIMDNFNFLNQRLGTAERTIREVIDYMNTRIP